MHELLAYLFSNTIQIYAAQTPLAEYKVYLSLERKTAFCMDSVLQMKGSCVLYPVLGY